MGYWSKQTSSRLNRTIVANVTSATATQATTPFGSQVRQIRYVSNLATWVTIGSTTAAAQVDTYVPANAPEYWTVTPGQVLSFSSSSTSSGWVQVSEMG